METSTSKFPEFIGVFENAVPDHLCDEMIDSFEKLYAAGFGVDRQKHDQASKIEKHDDSVFYSRHLNVLNYAPKNVIDCIWKNAYAEYASIFSILDKLDSHAVTDIKIQKTLIGGGYHVWHCENVGATTSRRLLAYTIYLNDIEEGGETEFLYYPKRIKAKKGTLCLFPCGFTHTHRGNPPISNTKYIATGWIEF
jgi:hypothetical protein